MEILSELFKAHRNTLLIIMLVQSLGTWFVNNKLTKIISAMPMPTKDSSPTYIFWFKFFNNLVGNELRANLPPLENSPNFLPAVEKHNAIVAASGNAAPTA